LKDDIQDADIDELVGIFDAVEAKTYRRNDQDTGIRLGLIAQDVAAAQASTSFRNLTGQSESEAGETTMTLDYARLNCVLWAVCKKLGARVAALEAKS